MARGTRATTVAERAHVAFRTHEYAHDRTMREYGIEAVERLGLDPERVFKTLVVVTPAGDHAVAVVPVARTLDLKALATTLRVKSVAMADPTDAERVTGYLRGGISPLGQKRRLPTVVDASAEAFETVFVSGGQRGLEIELAPADLVGLTGATVAAVART